MPQGTECRTMAECRAPELPIRCGKSSVDNCLISSLCVPMNRHVKAEHLKETTHWQNGAEHPSATGCIDTPRPLLAIPIAWLRNMPNGTTRARKSHQPAPAFVRCQCNRGENLITMIISDPSIDVDHDVLDSLSVLVPWKGSKSYQDQPPRPAYNL